MHSPIPLLICETMWIEWCHLHIGSFEQQPKRQTFLSVSILLCWCLPILVSLCTTFTNHTICNVCVNITVTVTLFHFRHSGSTITHNRHSNSIYLFFFFFNGHTICANRINRPFVLFLLMHAIILFPFVLFHCFLFICISFPLCVCV